VLPPQPPQNINVTVLGSGGGGGGGGSGGGGAVVLLGWAPPPQVHGRFCNTTGYEVLVRRDGAVIARVFVAAAGSGGGGGVTPSVQLDGLPADTFMDLSVAALKYKYKYKIYL
jgi:hypothetical protein